MNKHLAILASASLLLSGCIGIPLRIAKRLRDNSTSATGAEPGNVSSPPELRGELEAMVKQGAPGVTAIVMKGDRQLYRVDVGSLARKRSTQSHPLPNG